MNNLRLFYQKKLSSNLTGNLDKKQSHYVNKVMRLKENDKFNVFNESGEWVAEIKKIFKGLVEFKIMTSKEILIRLYKDYTSKYLNKILLAGFFSILVAGSTSAVAYLLDLSLIHI